MAVRWMGGNTGWRGITGLTLFEQVAIGHSLMLMIVFERILSEAY